MAEPERTTSFAKSVEGLHKEESALDRARSLRDQFVHAQEQDNEKQKPREAGRQQGESDKSGSQMVRQDAPVMRPTPSGSMRQTSDRFAANRKLEKEHKKAGTAPKDRMLRNDITAPAPNKPSAPTPVKQDPALEAAKSQAEQKAVGQFHARQAEIDKQQRPEASEKLRQAQQLREQSRAREQPARGLDRER
jgi:hypothetical protein